ncbi:PAQR family membrane homeostasis protein TrhA [Actinocorallia longicatena]|uniref:PAQR family membrane homeostasis protein TrhA n=1 Tax=Actinocorallia longicatena TaxID=111803 RepID=UPI0031DDCE8F
MVLLDGDAGADRVVGNWVRVRPRLRGALHAAVFPPVLVAGTVLVAVGSTLAHRLAAVVFVLGSVLLFGVSAAFHRGRWTPRVSLALRRLDHANIYLVIAASYTPFALSCLDGRGRAAALVAVGAATAAGITVRIGWHRAPRWVTVGLYLAFGWGAVLLLPRLISEAGPAVAALTVAGGLTYSAGGVVYALRRPDPVPAVFGYHEVFHAFTVVGYGMHFTAVALLVTGTA